jgi:hypothetical protein
VKQHRKGNRSQPAVAPQPRPASVAPPAPPRSKLQVHLYQLAGDEMFAANRPDGTGWTWSWADWRRDWMDATPNKFAYRCLPLTIANQTGWIVNNPVGFVATWDGRAEAKSVHFRFDTGASVWQPWVNDQFGNGIVTWNTPFLFKTQPAQSRLLVMGPANRFKHGAAPLTALIETDWMTASFTMNWKLTQPGYAVRFDAGEPLFQAIPMTANIGADLEGATVTYRRLAEDPTVAAAYLQWQQARDAFHQQKREGLVDGDAWQKDYFKGRDMLGRTVTSGHKTKLTPPAVHYVSPPPGKVE